ncbi:MAG TPA: hypothetical protein DCL48_15570 [Alphaproteobacteria bacterium]|nr:hypothetical protein [Alphaproteobacteria bacterium]
MASGTIDANSETVGPVTNGRSGVAYQVDITGTITVTLQASLDGATWMTATPAFTADAIGTHNIPGAAYRLIASGVTGGSAVCTLIAA